MKQVGIIIAFLVLFLLISQYLKIKDYTHSVYWDRNSSDWRQQKGLEDAKGKRVVFTGLCRNCSSVIQKNLYDAMDIGKYFKDYRIALFENDSSDTTREIIQENIARNKRIELIPCPEDRECRLKERVLIANGGGFSSYRMNRMADFRQRYIDHIEKKYPDWDYMIVVDWDYIGSLPLGGILDSLSYQDLNWQVMVANGKFILFGPFNVFYDGLAYVGDKANIDDYRYKDKNSAIGCIPRLLSSNIKILGYHSLMPVTSSFHGLSIYKIPELFLNGNKKRYEHGWKCEHIGFHRQFDKVYVNPNMKFVIDCLRDKF